MDSSYFLQKDYKMISLTESIKATWSSLDESLLNRKKSQIESNSSDAIRNVIFGEPGARLSNFGYHTLYRNDTADLWNYEISGNILTCTRNKVDDSDKFKINTEIAARIKNLGIDKVVIEKPRGNMQLVFDNKNPNDMQGLEFDVNLEKLGKLGIDSGQASYDNFKLTSTTKTVMEWEPDMKNTKNFEITCSDFELMAEFWKNISNKTKFVVDSPLIRCGNLRVLVTKLRKSFGLFDEKWMPIVEKFEESPVDLVKLLRLDFMELKNPETKFRFIVKRTSHDYLTYEITPFDKKLAQNFHIKLANGLYLDVWRSRPMWMLWS